MGSRIDLHGILKIILGSDHVYFQPPELVKMEYPCIVYERYDENVQFADNSPYIQKKCYQITVIDKNPDSLIPDKVSILPLCTFFRHFTADNLNHDVYNLYY
jgi:hypothetical protein